MTRGLDCKNPLNIKHFPNILWKGEIVPTIDPDGVLCTFDSMIDGLRAGAVNLLSYYYRDGCGTVSEVIYRYAPPTADGNDTPAYVDFMCDKLEVSPDQPIVMNDSRFLANWIVAQARFEQGIDCVSPEDARQAVQEALQYKETA